MMDKALRLDCLKQLDSGGLTIAQVMERHGGSERHWRRLLATYRKPKPERRENVLPPHVGGSTIMTEKRGEPVVIKPGETLEMPGVKITNTGSSIPPSMAEIDKALASGGVAAEQKGVDPALTADMALQGIRMAKMMAVVTSAELMGVKVEEKVMVKLCSLQPVTETIVRMQKPEAWAKLGELGSDPKALIGVLILDTMITGFALWRLRPVKEKDEEKKA